MAGQSGPKKDAKYIQELYEKRVEVVRALKRGLDEPTSVFHQMVAAYRLILDELLMDVALQAHRSVLTGMVKSAVDIFGQLLSQTPREEVTCVHCERRIAASRFAPHLEKCLGKGRNASRLASRRNS